MKLSFYSEMTVLPVSHTWLFYDEESIGCRALGWFLTALQCRHRGEIIAFSNKSGPRRTAFKPQIPENTFTLINDKGELHVGWRALAKFLMTTETFRTEKQGTRRQKNE